MFSSNERVNRPVTFGEALGVKAEGTLELNTVQDASCTRCGEGPRMYHHLSPKGRDVVVWIPTEHRCHSL